MAAAGAPSSGTRGLLALSLLLAPQAAMASGTSTGFGDLPPPPFHVEGAAEQQLMLELVVNSRRTGIIAPVIKSGARFSVRPADLARAGIRIEDMTGRRWLDELAGITAVYDAPLQLLRLDVAADMLPGQHLGRREEKFAPARYDMGALLNYDVYVSGGGGQKTQASVYHEARFFSAAGSISTTGALRSGRRKAYTRFDTVWRRSDEATATTIEVGDFITRSLPWAPAVRLGGIQVSRDFTVRPDVITYPLPEFRGSAALPSTVDLVVGGQRIAGGSVNPGPFELGGLPPINGAGEANLIVTDMHGRSIASAMPFYVSSNLLRPGLTDFSVALGAFREGYGVRDFDYGGVAGSAAVRHGVTNGITLEIRGELADDMQLAGGGAVVKLGNGGVVSGSYSRSFGSAGHGGQLTLGYEYQARFFSFALRHSRLDGDYTDLGSLDLGARWRARRITSATLSLSLGPGGTIGLGYFEIERDGGEDNRLASASWTLPLSSGARLNAAASREFEEKSWSGALSLSIALGGRRGNLGAGYAEGLDGRGSWRADYSRAVPAEGGLGWSASAIRDEGRDLYLRGDLSWRTDPLLLRAGAYGSDKVTGWFGASGALVFMDGGLFAANRIADAFVVVNTGEAGIPVRYENQLVGKTNKDGRLLIPWASAFYPAKYEIDPLALPANARVPLVSQRVAVARDSGHVLRFPVERLTAVRATLVDEQGTPLPAGAYATVNDSDSTYVGWDGMLFVEQARPANRLVVDLPDGGQCIAEFAAPATPATDIIDLGELSCRRPAH